MTNNKSNTNLKPKIKSAFRQAGGYVTRKDIGKAIRLRREDRPEFDRIIAAMIARGELREKDDKLMLAEKPDALVKAVVVKVNPTFGFAKPEEGEEDVFIAGRRMMGAMPGDTVLLRLRKDRNGRTEGEVPRSWRRPPSSSSVWCRETAVSWMSCPIRAPGSPSVSTRTTALSPRRATRSVVSWCGAA